MNKMADRKTSDLQWAFSKWKYVDLNRIKELGSKTKEELAKIHYKNQQSLEQMAD
jgi:hypothetical protein